MFNQVPAPNFPVAFFSIAASILETTSSNYATRALDIYNSEPQWLHFRAMVMSNYVRVAFNFEVVLSELHIPQSENGAA